MDPKLRFSAGCMIPLTSMIWTSSSLPIRPFGPANDIAPMPLPLMLH
jgi:hypothetical protein